MQDKQFDAIMEQLMNVTEQMTTLGNPHPGRCKFYEWNMGS